MPQFPDHSSTEPDPNRPDQPAMATERGRFLAHFRFSQRYGYEPLPEPMRLGHIPDDLRREICNTVRTTLSNISYSAYAGARPSVGQVRGFIEYVLGNVFSVTENEIATKVGARNPYDFFEKFLKKEKFNKILDLLEIMISGMERQDLPIIDYFTRTIIELFDKHSAAYQLDTSQRPYSFTSRANKEEGEAIQQAVETIRQGGMSGAVTHIRKARKFMNKREYADSIRESIHVVESVARKMDPASSKTLGPALKSLERAGLLKHKALKEGFNNIYGYTNDEEGIRHPLVDQSSADVGLDEAIFMFGACASFAAYLTQKHQHLTPKCPPESQDQQRRQDP